MAAFPEKPTIPLAPAEAALPVPTQRPPIRQRAERWKPDWQLIVFVFLPFATGYYLSYLFRTINALIAEPLRDDLTLGAADLGLLTSVYFLTFAAAQIPIGVLLDRYGPRRVQSALLLVAAAGAALFGTSQGFITLVIARAMIGLGVAAALTAGLKAIVLWLPKERVALANGYMIMLGALGAVTATAPAGQLIGWTGWRGLFELLAAATAGSAVLIYLLVPEHASSQKATSVSLKTVYTDLRFWRLAPVSATCVGTAWALQGLWAAPWLTDVEGLDQASLTVQLLVMAVALSLGALLLGTVADRLRRRGVGPQGLFAVMAAIFIAAQLTLIMRLLLPVSLPWSVVAVVGAGTVLSYAIVAEYFPKELAGRANAALNVFHLGWAFVIQYATGLVLEQWPSQDGHYPAIAYQVAFGLNVAVQVAALIWFEVPRLRAWASLLAVRTPGAPASYRCASAPNTPYAKAIGAWTERVLNARLQARSWRFAALASTSLCAVLGLGLAISTSRAQVTPYVVDVEHLSEVRLAASPGGPPTDAQIAYFLRRFVTNIRSLSTDPVVVRSNWIDALNYITARGAQMIKDYAHVANAFMDIGRRPVVVNVIYVVRASSNSFEVRWKEETYENGMIAKAERFTGTIEIVSKPIDTAEALRNPLGLYVDAFTWSPATTENSMPITPLTANLGEER